MATFKVIGRGQNGKYMDDYAREDVIAYVLQNDKTPHHCIGGAAVNIYNALQEMTLLARAFHKDTGLRLRHSVISFENDRGITLKAANQIAQQAIAYFGSAYQIIYAVHEDTEHLHIHLVMNSVSYLDGMKYHGSKKDYYSFIGYMKVVLRPYGIPFYPVK